MRGKGEASAARFDGGGSQRRPKPHVGVLTTSHLVLGMHRAWEFPVFLLILHDVMRSSSVAGRYISPNPGHEKATFFV